MRRKRRLEWSESGRLSACLPAGRHRVRLLEVTGQSGACAVAGVHAWRLRANQPRPDQLYRPKTCCTSGGSLASSLHRSDGRVVLSAAEARR